MKKHLLFFISVLIFPLGAYAQYQKPPQPIMDVLDAPFIPTTSVSPARDRMAMLEALRYPPISELAQPMLRLAGLRINPTNTTTHRQPYFAKLTFKNIEDGKETPVSLPPNAQMISPQWSADGKYFAAGSVTPAGVELWIFDTATGKGTKINGLHVNTAFGGYSWAPDQRSLLVNAVAKARGPKPAYQDITPTGPNIQETSGRRTAVQTFQDLLKSPNDELLFEYYTTSQTVHVTIDGKMKMIGAPAIYDTTTVSPDGKHILVTRIQKPFSYQYPFNRFPRDVEVWDMNGKVIQKVVSVPLMDNLPVQGVPVGIRGVTWVPTEAATLMWAEALDGGDPKAKVSPRDKVMMQAVPFSGQATEVAKTEQRYQGRTFGEKAGAMMFFDYDRDKNQRRIFLTDYKKPGQPKLISDLNADDRYNDIGNPVMKTMPNGFTVFRQNGDSILLTGTGASPDGDRPFLRRMDLNTMKTDEIFRSAKGEYETVLGIADDSGYKFLTRKESLTDPPNVYMRMVCPPNTNCVMVADKKITDFKDPSPQLRGITKQLVKYKRADGVDLSFTLYLPPGYKQGTRLPAVVWAYPLEFTNASTAGQVSGSTDRFTQIGGISHLFFLLNGYAVLDETTMPIVGDPETVNDTFVKQIVDSAQAAVDKAAEMGYIDPERVGVGGHSYGAFMTANLLAHSDIFRAGIARSGAYNRTLTPFGFQSERRTFWEAPEVYAKVSPFFVANKINEPILLTHGEADNNQGTFPMQSERLYAAISGTGGTARLVMLPLESHGYSARESTEHTIFEMVSWFDKYVKNAKPRTK